MLLLKYSIAKFENFNSTVVRKRGVFVFAGVVYFEFEYHDKNKIEIPSLKKNFSLFIRDPGVFIRKNCRLKSRETSSLTMHFPQVDFQCSMFAPTTRRLGVFCVNCLTSTSTLWRRYVLYRVGSLLCQLPHLNQQPLETVRILHGS